MKISSHFPAFVILIFTQRFTCRQCRAQAHDLVISLVQMLLPLAQQLLGRCKLLLRRSQVLLSGRERSGSRTKGAGLRV